VLEQAPHLLAIGAFCIGTNHIDLNAAAEQGIPVFNSPFSNTRSVAEMVIAAAIFLIRKVPPKARAAYNGLWLKSAEGAHEIRGKTMGIIGFGNIGSQIAVLAEAMGMKVLYHDQEAKLPYGNAQPVESLEGILSRSDIISLTLPENEDTVNLIGQKELGMMPQGSHLINFGRGKVVDLDALAQAISEGHIGGAAVDVFPNEPQSQGASFKTPLQGLENVLITPHIGGSTEEAQWNIGKEVAEKVVAFVDEGKTTGAINIPELSLPKMKHSRRVLNIHRNVPGVIRHLNSLLHEQGLNVKGQYLKAEEEIGYVVVDVQGTATKSQLEALKKTRETIRHRVLY
jgi:D-3-phosphoglycerate dehydrogenase